MPRINAFLQLGREQGCSDIHLAVGTPPLLRSLGQLTPVKYRQLSAEELEGLIDEIMSPEQRNAFQAGRDLDFAYHDEEVGRFRVNLFRKLSGVGVTFRVIPPRIPSLMDLGLPPIVAKLLLVNQGLILVTGATGTGKSTTLASMINMINNSRKLNIITLEDPIEFVHRSNQSLVIQREVGSHVRDFASGLRDALREDPDVILVGELRDPETISMAMTAAETGHLVLGTLHTTSASKTLDRIIDAMPTEQKYQAASFLAQHLHGVVSQKLVRSADGRSRVAVVEILINTPAIANLIMNRKVLQTSRDKGMQLMDQSLLEAVREKRVDPDDAYVNAADKKLFQPYVTNTDLLPQINLSVT
jgi:twitching motility protein PilT